MPAMLCFLFLRDFLGMACHDVYHTNLQSQLNKEPLVPKRYLSLGR